MGLLKYFCVALLISLASVTQAEPTLFYELPKDQDVPCFADTFTLEGKLLRSIELPPGSTQVDLQDGNSVHLIQAYCGESEKSEINYCAPRSSCSRICWLGKACGDGCIFRLFTCRKEEGTACDSYKVCSE